MPLWTIKALAREFAAKTTSIAHYFDGGFIRGPFSHETARLECILLGMQGLGETFTESTNNFGDFWLQKPIHQGLCNRLLVTHNSRGEISFRLFLLHAGR